MRQLFIAVSLIAGVVLPSYADSDGYYCVSPGYLAVEFRSFATPGIRGPHVLRIFRFDEKLGPRWTGELPVEDFQTHTLSCERERVIFAGVGSPERGRVTYVVNIASDGTPTLASVQSDPAYVFVPQPELPNLGLWARAGVTLLPSDTTSRRFLLRVTTESHRQDGAIHHDKKTVIEEVDATGITRTSLLIHEGTHIETVD